MLGSDPTLGVAENYLRFARQAAAEKSPLYAELCEQVAGDDEMLEFLMRQPAPKRQPNLLLAAVRVLFGTQWDYRSFRETVLTHEEQVEAILGSRRTQTNEPGRCAVLLPLLCQLPEPLALLEVGAAAGLCLLADHYGYDYGNHRLGSDEVVFDCVVHGPVPIPRRLPEIVWRRGIDLEPIDLDDPAAVSWLEALVWPEEEDRLGRLRAAITIGRRERPAVVRGDLLEKLEAVAAEAPPEATLVVFHTAVLAYLSPEERDHFQARVGRMRATWIANEGPGVLDRLQLPATKPVAGSHFVIAQDGQAVAYCDGHGRWIQWL